jgi:hypothetical protein
MVSDNSVFAHINRVRSGVIVRDIIARYNYHSSSLMNIKTKHTLSLISLSALSPLINGDETKNKFAANNQTNGVFALSAIT